MTLASHQHTRGTTWAPAGQRHGYGSPALEPAVIEPVVLVVSKGAAPMTRGVRSLFGLPSRVAGMCRVPGKTELATHPGAECHVIRRAGGQAGQPD
jgi:hypothetical protein